jgi:BON domain
MVTVHTPTRDCATAWRVRDALAAHPLLAGACVAIRISASPAGILLEGWVPDERIRQLALRLAQRSAGQRAVQCTLQAPPANKKLAQCIFDNNRAQAQG